VYIDGEYIDMRIFDITGREVFQQQYQGEYNVIELGKLAPGLYTLRIKTRRAIITKKIILTKL
jgi:hypothetical protein